MYSSTRSCSPKARGGRRHQTGSVKSCFSYASLAKIARRFNQANPNERIPISKSRDELWRSIKSRIPQCSDERCWTTQGWLSDRDRHDLGTDFKPPIPQGKYAWLNSDDIEMVLDQYENIFPKFRFVGVHPIDFQDVEPEVVRTIKRYLRSGSRVRSIGIVLNLDYHDEPGSHWTAVFIDVRRGSFEYFDSLGDKAPDEVYELYQRLESRLRTFRENLVIHQQKNTECGNYAINFILQRLGGASFDRVTHNIIRDEQMNRKRKIYFDPYHSHRE